MTLATGMGVRYPGARHSVSMLSQHEKTWMDRPWLTHLIVHQCNTSVAVVPVRTNVEYRCIHKWPAQLQRNVHLGAQILLMLYTQLPRHTYYAKIDLDTIIFPEALAFFLWQHEQRERPIHYFGTHEFTYRKVTPPDMHCERWGDCRPFDYAQGGFEGLSHRALQRIVNSECVFRMSEIPCPDARMLCLWQAEDVAIGACATAMGFPLTSCSCFFAWGPCNVYEQATCRGKLCERPLSVHKIKRPSWHSRWWLLGSGVWNDRSSLSSVGRAQDF